MYKKTAIIVDTFPRWSERFIARELQALRRAGVDLMIFALQSGEMRPVEEDWQGIYERCLLLPRCLTPRLIGGSTNPETRRRESVALAELGPRVLPKFKCADVFRTMLRDGGFQHLHAHFASLPSTLAWLAAAELPLTLSMSVHARDFFVEPQLLAEKAAACTRIFCCHARALEHAGKDPALKRKTVLMHHGVPLAQFPFNPRGTPANPSRLLAAGRFVPKKGFEVLLQACAELAQAGQDFQLALCGDGPLRAKLARNIARLQLSKKVSICAPSPKVSALFRDSDVFIAPYIEDAQRDSDGISNVILEAFALGLPVIGTQAGGLGEVLTPQTGIVVPQNNPAALTAAIGEYLANPHASEPRTRAARARIDADFDIDRNIAPLLNVLRK